MGRLSAVVAGTTALALVAGGITPAAAQGWGRPGPVAHGVPGGPIGWGGHHRRDRDDLDFGDFLGIAAIIGAVAIIASSADKDRRAQRSRDEGPRADEPSYDGRPVVRTGRDAALGDEDAAVDACAFAARDEGSRDGLFAEVREIGRVKAGNAGAWSVDGVIDQKQTFRASAIQARSFTCTWRDGRVTDLVLSREARAI